jgi:hypothetical protein
LPLLLLQTLTPTSASASLIIVPVVVVVKAGGVSPAEQLKAVECAFNPLKLGDKGGGARLSHAAGRTQHTLRWWWRWWWCVSLCLCLPNQCQTLKSIALVLEDSTRFVADVAELTQKTGARNFQHSRKHARREGRATRSVSGSRCQLTLEHRDVFIRAALEKYKACGELADSMCGGYKRSRELSQKLLGWSTRFTYREGSTHGAQRDKEGPRSDAQWYGVYRGIDVA